MIAIIITIMMRGTKVPHDAATLAALRLLIPVFLSYVLSFIFLGIYWNNHHPLWQTISQVNGRILWASLHLLFGLSLIPLVTGWMGNNNFATWPVVFYGAVMLLSAIAYTILTQCLIGHHSKEFP
ncbi:MAG: TMEM175 family protein [Thermosynechococcaceae cyanobacterium MS004]|nr:TMEM175 family protein [Thermosynechococcaceae cyanobacterium MS004]